MDSVCLDLEKELVCTNDLMFDGTLCAAVLLVS